MEKSPKINIIYEDNHLLVIEKPVGIPVQADSSNAIDLITLLKEYRIKNENKKGDAYIDLSEASWYLPKPQRLLLD